MKRQERRDDRQREERRQAADQRARDEVRRRGLNPDRYEDVV